MRKAVRLIIAGVLAMVFCYTHPVSAQPKITYNGYTLKGKVKKLIEFTNRGGFPLVTVYSWDTIKRKTFLKYYNEDHKFLGESIISYDKKDSIVAVNLYCPDGSLCERTSLKYNDYGKISKRLYAHHMSVKGCNRLIDILQGTLSNWFTNVDSSITLQKYRYNKNGLLSEVKTAYILTRPDSEPDTNASRILYTYDEYDRKKEIRHYKPGTNSNIPQKITSYIYDDRGKVLSETQKEIFVSSGIADTAVEMTTYTYNDSENMLTKTEMNIRSSSGIKDSSIKVVVNTYNSNSKITSVHKINYPMGEAWPDTVFDFNDYTYDVNGNIVKEVWYTDYKPAYGQSGKKLENWYHNGNEITTLITRKYNEQNQLIDSTQYYRAKEDEWKKIYGTKKREQTRHPEARVGEGAIYTYDSTGKRTHHTPYVIYQKEDGKETKEMLSTREWYNADEEEVQLEHDALGNIIKETYNGEVVLSREIEYY